MLTDAQVRKLRRMINDGRQQQVAAGAGGVRAGVSGLALNDVLSHTEAHRKSNGAASRVSGASAESENPMGEAQGEALESVRAPLRDLLGTASGQGVRDLHAATGRVGELQLREEFVGARPARCRRR